MSEYDIKAVQLGVRSSNPALPRQWTTMLCSLTADGIRYSPVANPEKAMLLIDLGGIESIGNYDTGKSEPAFQVKWKGTTTLHKCADDASVRNWVDKVMAAKLGPSVPESDSEDSDYDSEEDGSTGSSSEEAVKSSPETGKKLTKSEDKGKAKGAKAAAKPAKAKSKTTEVKKSKSKKEKSKEKEKKPKAGSAKENGSKRTEADSPKTPKRAKSSSSTDSYVPQWAAHYNGLRQQERQKELEALSTEELVRLVSGGLEKIAKEGRENALHAWSEKKRSKLIELHAIELLELQKKQQRELDDLPKQLKEFSEQPL